MGLIGNHFPGMAARISCRPRCNRHAGRRRVPAPRRAGGWSAGAPSRQPVAVAGAADFL